ncbi:MAG: hypothetical protein ACYSOF_01240 [Planctomycetota bacterium]
MTESGIKTYLKPAFIVCVAVLLTAAFGKEWVIWKFGVQMIKEPIALQHPLDEMNDAVLMPFKLKRKDRIQNRDVLESLGTDEYMQWLPITPATRIWCRMCPTSVMSAVVMSEKPAEW